MRPPFTRESRIRVDREGHFWHEGARVEHPGLARSFARWLTVDPETGRYVLKNDVDWCFVTVEDAPLVVRSIEMGEQGATLALSDGTREPLDPATLRLDEDDVPYCDVRGGSLPARFLPQPAIALLEQVRQGPSGLSLSLGGDWPLGRVPRGQGARRGG